jgi:DNA polymerase-3 subunit gamma/tau
VIECVNKLDERAPEYRDVLAELASVLQKVALLQAVPDLQLDEAEDAEAYQHLASALSPEDVQLFYQIAIIGRRDLELAPDARAGFEMVLLRMLAFEVGVPEQRQEPSRPTSAATKLSSVPSSKQVAPTPAPAAPKASVVAPEEGGEWSTMVARMNLQGMVRQLAAHCAFGGKQGSKVSLKLDAEGEHFLTKALEEKLTQALSGYYGEPMRVEISVDSAIDTLARQQKAAAEDRLQQAKVSIDNDPNVRAMKDIFGATVQPDSIRPVDNS